MSSATGTHTAEVKPFPAPHTAPHPEREIPAVEPVSPVAVPDPEISKATAKKGGSIRKRLVLGAILASAAYFGGTYGYSWWTDGRFMISTDDAYVQADNADIASKVSGYLAGIKIKENAPVKAGDLLFLIDDGDYRIARDMALAQIESHKSTLDRVAAQKSAAEAGLVEAQAGLQASEASFKNAKQAMERATQLRQNGVGSQATSDNATAAFDLASASLAGAKAKVETAKANIAVLAAQFAETQSGGKALQLQHDKSERDLKFTEIRAPFDGIVGNMATQEGDLVGAGQRLAALVPSDRLFIEANFKETQLGKISVGEKVIFTVDALPGRKFESKVESIAPASGAEFSLLPPENATGNFTKIVQRVPVRVAVPKELLDEGLLLSGLSVTVDIDTRTAKSDTAN